MQRLRSAGLEVQNYARRHIAVLEAFEDIVDCGERLEFNVCFNLAIDCEGKGFGHVFAIADEGAANSDAVGDDIKEWDGELARRQTYKDAGAAFARHADTLFERYQRRSGDEDTVGTTPCPLLDSGSGVTMFGVDD
jgi:hypothetical protein